jgi:uncharacterized cupin superfamily protein
MRAEAIDAMLSSSNINEDQVSLDATKAVQSHCAYTSAYKRAAWLKRIDGGGSASAHSIPLPVTVKRHETIATAAALSEPSQSKPPLVDANVTTDHRGASNCRDCRIRVSPCQSCHLTDLSGCAVWIEEATQVRLTRVVDCTVHVVRGVVQVAMEQCRGVEIVAGQGCTVRARDFTPNRLTVNYRISSSDSS